MEGGKMVTGRWLGAWDEAAVADWAASLRGQLAAQPVSFGLVFLSPTWLDRAEEILDVLRLNARIPLLLGCSSASLIDGGEELERSTGLVLALHSFPHTTFTARHIPSSRLAELDAPEEWHRETGMKPGDANGWLMFADPFSLPGEDWLRSWDSAYPGIPTVGGLSGGTPGANSSQLYLDGSVFDDGVVVMGVSGHVRLEHLTSQGCTPFGDAWTVTRADRNLIVSIGNRPAYKVLEETFNQLTRDEQRRAQHNLFVGFATNEYREDFRRGDFLVRHLLGADPQNGILAVQASPRQGQTIQFHRRDAASATEDLRALLAEVKSRLKGREILGGCLCCCNGRGQGLFGVPNHDASTIQEFLGKVPLTGFYANGELGPVGGQTFIHGYTASLALWVVPELRS